MARPKVGITGSFTLLEDQYPIHFAGRMNVRAVSQVAGALPLILPSNPDFLDIDEILDTCDGFLFTGARANVHPEEYGAVETPAHGAFDRERDRFTLPLIRRAVARGQPVLAICRGFQELAVAFGSTLHPEIRELPGRMNHRMPPDGTLEEKFDLRHDVHLVEGSIFHRIMGACKIRTNTLHGQGIDQPGPRIVIDGRADDGTAEAIHVADAPGFAVGVQWHPEWRADEDPASRRLFEAFGDAVSEWASGVRPVLRTTA